MFSKLHTLSILFIFTMAPILGQDGDSTEAEDEGGREIITRVDLSFSQEKGNTEYLSKYYSFYFSLIGDAGPLQDTEFSFSFSRSVDRLDGESFMDDQSLILKFDLWANQKLSPFLFFEKSFDKTIGLSDRLNYGLGAKVGTFMGLSLSYAFLAEKETYALAIIDDIQIIDISEMEDWELHYEEIAYDTTFDTTYTSIDSTSEFLRHSIRPKFKIKLFDENIVFDYRFYFKPKVEDFNDYLLEHELKISIATFYELLTVNLNYSHKYNSRYDSEDILNPDTYEFYKPVDESISIGLSFMF